MTLSQSILRLKESMGVPHTPQRVHCEPNLMGDIDLPHCCAGERRFFRGGMAPRQVGLCRGVGAQVLKAISNH